MPGRLSRIVVLLLMGSLAASPGVARNKCVALVIGNSDYKHTPRLENPKNDAADMAAQLKKLGFAVMEGRDLDKAGMDRTIRDFAETLGGAQVGLFFYAGHGLQVGGQNYLVPIDAKLTTASAVDFEMVRLDLVHRTMEREAGTNILMMDACRDNPLARNLARALGTRSTPDRARPCRCGVRRRHLDQLLDAAGQRRSRRDRTKFALCGGVAEAHRDAGRRPANHPHQRAQ
jgi:Caspase domain